LGQHKSTVALTERLTKSRRKKGKKDRKWGRNLAKCKLYREFRSVRNKRRKLNRHLARHDNDGCAKLALSRVK
jgi:hypothetical protein